MALTFLIAEGDAAEIGGKALDALARVYGGFFSPADLSVDISLIGKEEMQQINNEYRSIDEPTDVLSFPLYNTLEDIRASSEPESLLGSLVICPEKADAYEETLPQLVHHGLLHLAGFDHETDVEEWKAMELPLIELLAEAGLTVPSIPYELL